jgi:hypothetical protein
MTDGDANAVVDAYQARYDPPDRAIPVPDAPPGVDDRAEAEPDSH